MSMKYATEWKYMSVIMYNEHLVGLVRRYWEMISSEKAT